jgi:hypothetical protein
MKEKKASKRRKNVVGEMRQEYRFDYRKSRPNRFAAMANEEPLVVIVDPDLAQVFTTSESVNRALRAVIAALPRRASQPGVANRR